MGRVYSEEGLEEVEEFEREVWETKELVGVLIRRTWDDRTHAWLQKKMLFFLIIFFRGRALDRFGSKWNLKFS